MPNEKYPSTLAALGEENVRWVGGAVRDTLLGAQVHDVARISRASVPLARVRQDNRQPSAPLPDDEIPGGLHGFVAHAYK